MAAWMVVNTRVFCVVQFPTTSRDAHALAPGNANAAIEIIATRKAFIERPPRTRSVEVMEGGALTPSPPKKTTNVIVENYNPPHATILEGAKSSQCPGSNASGPPGRRALSAWRKKPLIPYRSERGSATV